MNYQAVALIVTAGIALGLAVFNYFSTPPQAQRCTYDDYTDVNYTFEPRSATAADGRRRRRRSPAQTQDCSICLSEIVGLPRKLSCGHVFHRHCIEQWFKTGNNCPNCRVGR